MRKRPLVLLCWSISFSLVLLPYSETLICHETVSRSCSLHRLAFSYFAQPNFRADSLRTTICPSNRFSLHADRQNCYPLNRVLLRNGWSSLKASLRSNDEAKTALQKQLWEELDVLPTMDNTPIRLQVTQDTDSCNLGFIALKPIKFGDVLVSVPWQFAISVDAEDRRGAPSDMRLALKLLETIHPPSDSYSNELRREVWRLYVQEILPKYSNAAVLWNDAQIEEIQFENAMEFVRAFKNQIDEYCVNYLEAGGTFSEAELRWALGVVRSRSFLVDMPGNTARRQRALVPVADLFNHLPEAPADWAAAELAAADLDLDPDLVSGNPWQVVEGDDNQLYLDVYSHRAWAAGEEVLLPYGLETNLELLASHGVVLGSNPADYVPLFQDLVELVGAVAELELREDEAAARAKLQRLESADAAAAPLAVRPGDTPAAAAAHLLGFLQVAYAAPAELNGFEEVYCPAAGHYILAPRLAVDAGAGGSEETMSERRAAELAARARGKVVELCGEELGRLASTIEADEAALAAVQVSTAGREAAADEAVDGMAAAAAAQRRRLALQFRVSQKRLLTSARDACLRAGTIAPVPPPPAAPLAAAEQ